MRKLAQYSILAIIFLSMPLLASCGTLFWKEQAPNVTNSSAETNTINSQARIPGFDNREDTGLNMLIFGDSLNPAWNDTSWYVITSNDYRNRRGVFKGAYSIRSMLEPWGAFQLECKYMINSIRYYELRFSIYSDKNSTISVRAKSPSNYNLPAIQLIVKQGWNELRVKISELDPTYQNFNSFYIQNYGLEKRTFYLDDIYLVSSEEYLAQNYGIAGNDFPLMIYDDAVRPPWTIQDVSGGIAYDSSSDMAVQGFKSIKFVADDWGAFSLRHGSYWSKSLVDPKGFQTLYFSIFVADAPARISVALGYSDESTGGKVQQKDKLIFEMPKGEWTSLEVPIADLDPERNPFNNIIFSEYQPGPLTFYLDNISLTPYNWTWRPTINISENLTNVTAPILVVKHSPELPETNDTLVLTAAAADSAGIAFISIYVDGSLGATCTIDRCNLSGRKYSEGLHTYYAVAVDKQGVRATYPSTGVSTFTVTSPSTG